MASFGGHALPGALLIILSLFLTIEYVLIYYTKRAQFNKASWTMITLATIGIMVELFWPVPPNEPPFGRLIKPGTNEWYKPMNWQHSTMYTFFFIYGLSRLTASSSKSLKGIDRLAGALAFGIEGYLFYNHVHGRSPLDTKIHLLITLICLGTASVFFLSFFLNCQRKTFIMDMIIAILVFAQGTWFWHVAFILYGPHPWITPADKVHMDMHNEGHEDHHEDDLDDDHHQVDAMTNMVEEHMGAEHMDTMFAVLFFAWHLAFAMGAISLLAYLIHKFLARRGLIETAPFDQNANHYRSTKQPHSSRGAYEALEVDETPLLEQEEEENVLFTKA